MLRRSVDSLLGAMLVAALLPVVILSALREGLRFRWNRKAQVRDCAECAPAANATVSEFQFERAIEAYESLIDAVIAENRACPMLRK